MMLPSCTTEVDPNARELLLLISYRQLRLRLRLRIGSRMAKRKRIKSRISAKYLYTFVVVLRVTLLTSSTANNTT
eukprot:scaffold13850_cov95-Skeletonema_dohrnii-CCMP3373.AAC.1